MLKQWKWALNVKPMSWVVAFDLGKDGAIVANRYFFLRVVIWSFLYMFSCYKFLLPALREDPQAKTDGCFNAVMHETFKVYNVAFVMLGYAVVGLITNTFCILRLNFRDVPKLVNKSITFYKKVICTVGQENKIFERKIKCMLLYTYISPFLLSAYLSFDCSGGTVLSSLFWVLLGDQMITAFTTLPGPATTTVFFLTLESINQSLATLSRSINELVLTKGLKTFLAPAPLISKRFPSKTTFNARSVYSLRKIHDELVLFTEEVMQFFQADILVFFVLAFYYNILFCYAMVTNGVRMFQSKDSTDFMLLNFVFVVGLMVNLWAICAGPSRIQDQQRELMNSVSRLSTVPHANTDIVYEIKMFQLQSRNHKSSFEVYGMFKLNNSLLFTMCASITSYIVVLIQFTFDSPPSSGGSLVDSNTTVAAASNVSTANATVN